LLLALALLSICAATASAQTPEQVADNLLGQMTLAEKVTIIHGNSLYRNGGVPRLGIPDFFPSDGPCSVRPELDNSGNYINSGSTTDCATAFPPLSTLAATWDPELAQLFGQSLGSELRARGKDMSLGPAINIMRTPVGGRTFEYMGEDPCLTANLCVPIIRGVQTNDLAACIKHFALNNQELNRDAVDVHVSERALREIYLPGFEAAVKEGQTRGLMGAYNRVRGQWCCENPYLLQSILRGEWGYKGVVISDWGAIHDTIQAVTAGTDMDSGNASHYPSLTNLVQNGTVAESVVNERARNMLIMLARIKKIGPDTALRTQGEINTGAHQAVARRIAQEGIVLLKNDNAILPLNPASIQKLLVVGTNADARLCVGINTSGYCDLNLAGGSGEAKPLYEITALQGITNRLGTNVQVTYLADGTPSPALTALAQAADAVLIFTGDTHVQEQEGKDRADITLPGTQNAMVSGLAGINPRTVVINQSGAPVAMPWVSNTPAIVQYWFGGQEGGNALAAIVFGDANPCGRLPCTFPQKLTDVPAHSMGNYVSGEEYYSEDVFVGYRWFDGQNIQPLFPFGHGLSYTTFGYSAVTASNTVAAGGSLTVSVTVTNTGARFGAEVVQLYLHAANPALPSPPQALKAFQKLRLNPGESQTAVFTLAPRDFSYWDVNFKGWHPDAGSWEVRIGSSSRDIRSTANVQLQPYPTIVNDGVLNPGGPGTNGVLATESFTQTTNGTLVLDVSGAGTNDSVTAFGTATLAGTLVLTNLGGFVPASGQSFTLIQAPSLAGAFDTLILPALPGGLNWKVFKSTPTTLLATIVSSRTWDAAPATSGPQDGAGTWDTASTNWWDSAANVLWSTNPPDSATFGAGNGAAGVVALAAPVSAANLTFNAPGSGHYILTNGSLMLATPALVTVNDDTTIASPLTGGAMTKTGAGTLTFLGNTSFASSMLVDAGTVKVVQGTNFQSASVWISPGATLEFNIAGAATMTGVPGTGNTIANLQSVAISGGGSVRVTGTGYSVAGRGGAFTCNQPAGAWFDVQSSDIQFGWQQSAFAANSSSLNVAPGAGFHCSDPAFQFDAITGSGAVGNAYNTAVTLTVGVAGTQNNAAYGISNNTALFSGVIKDHESYNGATTANLGLLKTGGGTQILCGTNTYQGPTLVSGGTLLVNSPGSLAAASAVTVQNGGTLGGNGAIGGSVTVQNGGTLAPGSGSLATLTINGALTFNAGATNIMRLSKQAGPMLTSSLFTGMAGVTYGGTLKVIATGASLADGDTFTLFQKASGAYAGAFTNYDLPPLPAGLTWLTSGLTLNGTMKVSSTVNSPSFTPPAGAYVSPQSVTIASDLGATIYYTLDGSTPTAVSASGISPVVVSLPANTNSYTISAYATLGGFSNSPVAVATYATTPVPTWMAPANGSWAGGANWSNSVIANARGVAANFAARTLPANTTVTLDSAPTVGQLVFGDVGNAWDWTVTAGSGGPLTLDAGAVAPAITVSNRTTTIGAVLAGTNGLTKTGNGTLILNAANTYTGPTAVNGGKLVLKAPADADWTLPTAQTGGITIASGATTTVDFSPQSTQYRKTVLANNTINSGGVLELTGPINNANGWYLLSTWSAWGGGTIRVLNGGIVCWTASVNALAGFTGLLDIQGGQFSANHQVGTTLGGTLDVNVGSGGTFDLRSGDVLMDALTGSGPVVKSAAGYASSLTLGNNNGSATFSGNMSGNYPVIKAGTGTQTLSGTNTYAGTTTVNGGTLVVNGSLSSSSAVTVGANGILAGTGTIGGVVTVQPGAILQPGAPGIGTLTLGRTPSFAGEVRLEISKGASPNADKLSVSGQPLVYAGTLTVTNIGTNALAAGDTFTLFSASIFSGSFAATNLPALPAGLGWIFTPTNGVLSVIQVTSTIPTNLLVNVAGGSLNLTWPADHLGWHLETQTNSLSAGLRPNWVAVPGSTNTTSVSLPLNPANPTVFYRLAYP
jgi:beta-glucosidase